MPPASQPQGEIVRFGSDALFLSVAQASHVYRAVLALATRYALPEPCVAYLRHRRKQVGSALYVHDLRAFQSSAGIATLRAIANALNFAAMNLAHPVTGVASCGMSARTTAQMVAPLLELQGLVRRATADPPDSKLSNIGFELQSIIELERLWIRLHTASVLGHSNGRGFSESSAERIEHLIAKLLDQSSMP